MFAGYADINKGWKLKEESSARLHVLQLDVTSEKDIHDVYTYINKNLPSGAAGKKTCLINIQEMPACGFARS